MASTLDQIIADLEKQAQAPDPAVETEKTAENQAAQTEMDELRKLATDLDAQGRAIARGFMSELQKEAVGVSELTPNTAAVPDNPAVQVGEQDVRLSDVSKVESIIKKLTLGGEAKVNPAGVIHENNQPVAATQPIVVDEVPVAADVKKANAEIVEHLFNKYFAS